MNVKHERFAQEYLLDGIGSKAAIKAGFSPKSAAKIASQLLKRPDVKAIIDAERARMNEETRLTRSRILDELRCIALANPKGLFKKGNQLKTIHEMPDDLARAISSIERRKDGSFKIRFWPKGQGLELAARILGILQDGQGSDRPPMTNERVAERLTFLVNKVVIVNQPQTIVQSG